MSVSVFSFKLYADDRLDCVPVTAGKSGTEHRISERFKQGIIGFEFAISYKRVLPSFCPASNLPPAIRYSCQGMLMIRDSSILLLLLSLALGLSRTEPAIAQQSESPSAKARSIDAENLRQQLQTLRQTQTKMQQALQRIEAQLESLQDRPSEFSHVTIHVESIDGKPIEGYDIHLFSESDEGRKARARGTSNADGPALDRYMPFGDYSLSVRGYGWSTYFRNLHVELQTPLKLTVVAPDPQDMGKLQIETSMRATSFAKLPFGTVTESRGNGYTYSYVPEPDEVDEGHSSFPRPGSGITTVGANLDIKANVSLKQPDGELQQWDWSPEITQGYLMATPDGFTKFDNVESERKSVPPDAPFYSSVDRDKSILFYLLRPSKQMDSPLTLSCPATEVEITVEKLLGQCSSQLADVFVRADDLKERTVWLPVALQKESAWLPKLFSLGDWQRSKTIRWELKRTVQIERGKSFRITLASSPVRE